MTLLNTADAVYVGSTAADKVYLGTTEVWSAYDPIDPTTISGLVLWLKADAITGLVNNDPVTTWEDSSTANNDATQATGAAKPVYKTNIVNGKPVLRFDAARYMDTPANSTLSQTDDTITIFAVARLGATAGFSAIISCDTGDDGWKLHHDNGNSFFKFRYGSQAPSFPAVNTTDFHIYAGVVDATNTSPFMDGTAVTPVATDTTTAQIDTKARIGAYRSNSTSNLLNGDIAEILIYDSALSSTDREAIEGYLGWKYGITV